MYQKTKKDKEAAEAERAKFNKKGIIAIENKIFCLVLGTKSLLYMNL